MGDNAGGVSRPAAFPWPQQPDWKDGDEDDIPDLSETHAAGASCLLQVCPYFSGHARGWVC